MNQTQTLQLISVIKSQYQHKFVIDGMTAITWMALLNDEPAVPFEAAHKAALPALQALVVARRDPADYEMLGMSYVILGEEPKALEIFKKALEIERARSPGSDLCGDLMRRVSQL